MTTPSAERSIIACALECAARITAAESSRSIGDLAQASFEMRSSILDPCEIMLARAERILAWHERQHDARMERQRARFGLRQAGTLESIE